MFYICLPMSAMGIFHQPPSLGCNSAPRCSRTAGFDEAWAAVDHPNRWGPVPPELQPCWRHCRAGSYGLQLRFQTRQQPYRVIASDGLQVGSTEPKVRKGSPAEWINTLDNCDLDLDYGSGRSSLLCADGALGRLAALSNNTKDTGFLDSRCGAVDEGGRA